MLKTAFVAAVVAIATMQGASEFVELDVVALDRHDRVVTDLTQPEFEVTEAGKPVTIQTFTAVAARGVVDEERSIVLLMDDVGVPSGGTSPMRQIGRLLLSPMSLADDVAVIRLSRARDEAFGDVESALDHINGYHGGAVPFSPRDTPQTMLKAVARIAQQLEPVEHRRKAVVCLGSPSVCDVREPLYSSTDEYRTAWASALSLAARANVSVYEVDPTGLTQSSRVTNGSLVRQTGGDVLRNSNDFGAAGARIWGESSHYYLLGYWTVPSAGHLRPIEVRTSRGNVQVRARRFR